MFDQFDSNKDGKLSEEEVQRFLKAIYINESNTKKSKHELTEQIMTVMDKNQNREIDREEFYHYYKP